MSLTKNKIMQSAIRLFSKKGYQSTSIQDIADDCSIAKGTIYKFFPSKEDLYIHILDERHQQMSQEIDHITQNPGLTPRNRFIAEIDYQIRNYMNYGSNDNMELAPFDSSKIRSYIDKFMRKLLAYYRDLLMRYYGSDVKDHAWDLAALFSGALREYNYLMFFGNKPLSYGELTVFIAEQMDSLVEGLKKSTSPSILSDSLMGDFVLDDQEEFSIAERKALLYEVLLSTIQEINVSNSRKSELREVLLLLKEEGESEKPRQFLLNALLNDLAKENELGTYVSQLNRLISTTLSHS
ncbi:transcriptional regulator, TetR family [Paenibacillus sophorae]|uniref:TetR/AcrR family transcriptional regulator n=1 Tax=Paenibacillus sophorae TaxID=1333845 RepID=A0A1H8R0V9_9BACL|nr:TetR/AcrR family transcriptional regulator [Paenibacillus sophorae]QWU14900.1 TetR/AcrR family transcriptional regulator [Paenibacillus sophorae]SEO59891.1 transcriptional regulator, TetR family [Paenibacillus sophorae]